jgi:hypothetical protein
MMKAAIVLFVVALVPCYGGKAWLDAKVVAVGHISDNGRQIPTATIILYDPDNANPLAREQVWAITTAAQLARKTRASLSVGTTFKAYRTGENSQSYGYFVIRYVDDKSREKGEPHAILQALGIEDVPAH